MGKTWPGGSETLVTPPHWEARRMAGVQKVVVIAVARG